jgi:hypothetical protein
MEPARQQSPVSCRSGARLIRGALRYDDDRFEPEVIKGDLMITNATTLVLGALVLVVSAALVALYARLAQLRSRYKVITDTEAETRNTGRCILCLLVLDSTLPCRASPASMPRIPCTM